MMRHLLIRSFQRSLWVKMKVSESSQSKALWTGVGAAVHFWKEGEGGARVLFQAYGCLSAKTGRKGRPEKDYLWRRQCVWHQACRVNTGWAAYRRASYSLLGFSVNVPASWFFFFITAAYFYWYLLWVMQTCCRQTECSIATSPQLTLAAAADVPDNSSVVTGDFWRTQLSSPRVALQNSEAKQSIFCLKSELRNGKKKKSKSNAIRDVLALQTAF